MSSSNARHDALIADNRPTTETYERRTRATRSLPGLHLCVAGTVCRTTEPFTTTLLMLA
jgi:hypothetical protein